MKPKAGVREKQCGGKIMKRDRNETEVYVEFGRYLLPVHCIPLWVPNHGRV